MRWERLFNELEAQAGDLEILERDALVDELRDGEWAETSWRSLLGGSVVIDVLGVGRIAGECVLVNEHLVQLQDDRQEHVVSAAAVIAVVSSQGRAGPPSSVSAALGWGHVFRALRDAGETVRVQTINRWSLDGTVDVVGKDFVRVCDESGRAQSMTFAMVAAVSGQR